MRNRSAIAALGLVVTALLGASLPTIDDDEARNPAYWIGRMEQALLPGSSVRARLTLEDRRSERSSEFSLRLVRVQQPEGIRSIVVVEEPRREREVLEIVSRSRDDQSTGRAEGRVRRVSHGRGPEPLRQLRDRHDPFLLSAFTYEDLGFVELSHRAEDAQIEIEPRPDGRVVEIQTPGYGPYDRVLTRLDWATALPIEVEFFDDQGTLERAVSYEDVRREGDADPYPTRIEVVEPASGRRSVVQVHSAEFGTTVHEYELEEPHLDEIIESLDATPDVTPP